MTDNEAPKTLGRYQIIRELGHGAMGIVYEGIDPNIGRRVAIKTARRDVLQASGRADEMMERFLREAKAAGALNHPSIITIYDADEEADGLAYIAMEFLDGQDLFKLFREKRRLGVKDTVEIGATVCAALAHAHEHGVVHRDVKPSNIIMLNNGQIKVADFGIARVSDSNLTQEGAMIGTPHYMSPEQFMGHQVDARSDLFSVGIILYELLTGEKPFAGEALSAVMHNVIKVNPVAPRELNFAVNECLSRVIMKAMSKDPAERYQDGNAMAAALRECLKENPDPSVTHVGAVAPHHSAAETLVSGASTAETVMGPGAPGAPGETMTAGGPSAAANRTGSSGVAPGGSGTAQSEKPDSRRRTVVYAAAALTVLAIVIGVLFLRDGTTGTTPGTGASAGSGTLTKGTYYEKAIVTINLMPANVTSADMQAISNGKPAAAFGGKLGDGEVILTSHKQGIKPIPVKVYGGTMPIDLGPEWQGFSWSASSPGYVPNSGDVPDPSGIATASVEVYLSEAK